MERISAGRRFREGQLPAGAAAGTSVSLHCPLVDGVSLASRQLEGLSWEFELIVATVGGFGETWWNSLCFWTAETFQKR